VKDDNTRVRQRRSVFLMLAVLVAWLSAVATYDAAGTDIKVDFDKTFSFAGLRTWSWHPDGAGDVKLWISAEDDPKRVAARVDPIIVPAVDRELAGRGYARVDDRADLFVHYYVLATVGQSAQTHGQFLPAVPQWGVPPFTPSTSALSIYPVGTLIIDVTSPSLKAIVWRGAAERKIDVERPDAERRKVLESAIRDLIRRFPQKK
jgi:hypothetical protein